MRFLARAGDAVYRVDGPPLGPGWHSASAALDRDGTLRLEVDGEASAPTKGRLLARMPADGLDVGADSGAPVGPYSSPSPYPGRIRSVVIEVGR